MKILFPERLCSKSKVYFDVTEVNTFGRYILLLYQVANGGEDEKATSFRRRLDFGKVEHDLFVVQTWMRMIGDGDDVMSASSSPTLSDGEPPCSQYEDDVNWSPAEDEVRIRFWVVMVRFSSQVVGTERFRQEVEGYPFCVVKRDLNVPGHDWLAMWQQWMRESCVPGSEAGYPVRIGGDAGQVKKSKCGSGRSPYFSQTEGPKRRRVEEQVDESEGRRPMLNGMNTLRQGMLEHRVAQLEDRIRGLEQLLVRCASGRELMDKV